MGEGGKAYMILKFLLRRKIRVWLAETTPWVMLGPRCGVCTPRIGSQDTIVTVQCHQSILSLSQLAVHDMFGGTYLAKTYASNSQTLFPKLQNYRILLLHTFVGLGGSRNRLHRSLRSQKILKVNLDSFPTVSWSQKWAEHELWGSQHLFVELIGSVKVQHNRGAI